MRLHRLTVTTALVTALALPSAAADPDLIVFDWAGWEIPELIQGFHEKYGQGPTYTFFADDDEAFQKVASGFKVDIAHPCSAKVPAWRDAGLIEPWDVSRIPEFANIEARFLENPSFKDDQGVWYIPTDYAYTAIAYNTETVPAEDVASLQVFHNPAYAGRISLPDNVDDTWALAFLATGVQDWSNVTEEQIAAAGDWLRVAHENVRTYWADPSELAQLMVSGEVAVAWSWNDGVALLQAEGFPVGFNRTPTEGASNWFCGYVNLKDAPGSEDAAYDFINAFMEHRTATALLENIGYIHSNAAAMAEVPMDARAAAFADPVEGILLSQTPMGPGMRERLLEEFEKIKAGF